MTLDGDIHNAAGRPDSVTPTLLTRDWNEEWKALQRARRRPDDPAQWDERAATYGDVWAPSVYRDRFLTLAGLRDGESVLDMGCGNGMLALPLAAAGHEVVAADFSEGMLAALRREADSAGIRGIHPVLMSWADDWEAFGVGADSVDVGFASRSIVTADLRDSLIKLSRAARRRCCITMPTAPSPRIDPELLTELGIEVTYSSSYLYAVMILARLGASPELSYIVSRRDDRFASPQEAEATLGRMVRDALGNREDERTRAMERLRAWLADNLVTIDADAPDPADNPLDGAVRPSKRWKLRRPRQVRWAFIAWDSSAVFSHPPRYE